MSKQFVIGDIHGNYKALIQCLERSKFDYDNDTLIIVGDICDGFKYVKECIDELLKIKDVVFILGNHDSWALDWMMEGYIEHMWKTQGGEQTMISYGYERPPQSHIDFLNKNYIIYVGEFGDKQYAFVHGGLNPDKTISEHTAEQIMWDRDLLHKAYMTHNVNKKPDHKYTAFDKVFLGHTSTQYYIKRGKSDPEYWNPKPAFWCNIIGLDTGAGWSGNLTIMDINTLEYWQSDSARDLYPDEKGRG